jgi:hypothetical protein
MSIAYKYGGKLLPKNFPYDEMYVKPATGFELHMEAVGTVSGVRKINF